MNGVLKVVFLSNSKDRYQRFSVEVPVVSRTPNTTFDVITSLVSIEYGVYGCES
jgi:hypothetical protein